MKRKSLNICFSDFKETNDYEHGAEFIKSKFENLNERPDEKMLICHLTCATSTENIQVTYWLLDLEKKGLVYIIEFDSNISKACVFTCD